MIRMITASALCVTVAAAGRPASAAETLTVAGTGAAIATMRIIGTAFEQANPGVKVIVPKSLGSGGGIKALLKGKIDIALASRPIKDSERAAGAVGRAYARTPFLLVVSGTGHADLNHTSREIEDIFAYRKTAWSDGHPVRFVLRPESDSDTTMLVRWFPSIKPLLETARRKRGIITATSDQQAMDVAERVPGTVTTSTLTAITAENRKLQPLIIDGIAPTPDNINDGTYKWFKELLYVTTSTRSVTAKAFLEFLMSPNGARLLRETGNVPMTAPG